MHVWRSTKTYRLSWLTTEATKNAYTTGRANLKAAGKKLSELRRETGEVLNKRVDRATSQLEELEERIEGGVNEMKDASVSTARDAQLALTRRLHRTVARVGILRTRHGLDRV